jgi:hypothetical protein
MAKKSEYGYLFEEKANLFDQIVNATEEASEEMQAMIKVWDGHVKNASKTTLGEAKFFGKTFAEALQVGTSKGGYPQLQIGSGPTHLGKNTIAGINALRSIASGKYAKLQWHFHQSWFDPRRDAIGVVSAFVNGEWKFFDWRNGAYVPSRRMDTLEYLNRVRKHEEIDKLIQSLEFGSSYTLVFNRDLELSLYQERIKDSLEKTLDVVWADIAQEYAEAASRGLILRGDATRNDAVKANPDKLIVNGVDLTKVKKPVTITYNVPSSTRPVIIYFDPADEKSKKILDNLAHAPSVQIVSVEEVTE